MDQHSLELCKKFLSQFHSSLFLHWSIHFAFSSFAHFLGNMSKLVPTDAQHITISLFVRTANNSLKTRGKRPITLIHVSPSIHSLTHLLIRVCLYLRQQKRAQCMFTHFHSNSLDHIVQNRE